MFHSYNFKESRDKDSFLAGMIDGDGCFCSHKSKSGKYWRFQFGVKKPREIKYFEMAMGYTNIRVSKRKTKKGLTLFEVLHHKKIIELIERIKDKSIIKKEVIDLIYPQLIEFEKNKIKVCSYCNNEFLHYYSKYDKNEFHCNDTNCIRAYNAKRMRRLRREWKEGNLKVC